MLNPVIYQRKYLFVYAFVWLCIIIIQILAGYLYRQDELLLLIADAFVFDTIFALLGLNVWYPIKILRDKRPDVFILIINHMVIAAVVVSIWLGSSYLIMNTFFVDEIDYQIYLKESLPWRAIIGLQVYTIIVLFYYVILYYEDLRDKIKEEGRLNNLVKDAELSALKSQINPHFLFNSLNSISSLTITNPEKAHEMILKLSDLMRYSINRNHFEMATLGEEMANIQKYVDIEKTRFGSRLIFKEEFDERCKECRIPNMILQPVVENAIKHGMFNTLDAVTVSFFVSEQPDGCFIQVSNNYQSGKSSPEGQGIGLSNIRERLSLVYKRSDLLNIEDKGDFYKVSIFLPHSSS